jgi:hypothetical protein
VTAPPTTILILEIVAGVGVIVAVVRRRVQRVGVKIAELERAAELQRLLHEQMVKDIVPKLHEQAAVMQEMLETLNRKPGRPKSINPGVKADSPSPPSAEDLLAMRDDLVRLLEELERPESPPAEGKAATKRRARRWSRGE